MNIGSFQNPSLEKPPIRRYRRLSGWDYSKGASFFITISTEPSCGLARRIRAGFGRVARLRRATWFVQMA